MTLFIPPSASIPPEQTQVDSRLTPEVQLILTCARLELTPQQRQHLRYLCGVGIDWADLMRQATRHLMAPLVYRHLKVSALDCVPTDVLAALYSLSQNLIVRTMAMAANQQHLVQQILQPLGVPYALIKGPSLAQRYYHGLGLRQCRDLDILIDPDRLFEVVEATTAHGYQVDPGMLSMLYPGAYSTRQDLEIGCRHESVMMVISPNGVRVELHQRLENKGHIFNPRYILSKAEPFRANGVTYQVLPTTELFVYICYHHSRHQWAHLHWLADLDAMQRHPSFDRQAVETFALQVGLLTTVKAALALHGACGNPAPHRVRLKTPAERSMLDTCLHSLTCEGQIKAAHGPRSDAYDAWYIRLRYLVIVFLRPTYEDYKALALPESWHGVYYLVHPFRMWWKALNKLFSWITKP